LRRSREAFDALELRARVLRDVSKPDPSTTILGRPSALPLVLAPTGFTRMVHHEGERAVAASAAAAGIPYALSTVGTTSVEDLAASVTGSRLWFQLYVWQDRPRSQELVDRAAAAGYEALVLTVDVPVQGARMRDVRNGMTIPPTLTARSLLDFARHPAWWGNLLTTEPLSFASFSSGPEALHEIIGSMFDPAMTIEDVAWLRAAWPRALVVKGVQTVDDARILADAGVDAIVLSNHGGRQLDQARPPVRLLPEVVDAVGDRIEVMVDSGIRTGTHIAAAVALGARACLVGRAYLYGLMAAGGPGVDRSIAVLADELVRTMQLLGAPTITDLTRDLVAVP
jgi:L-lactate dehydrogenase (cytochrome)